MSKERAMFMINSLEKELVSLNEKSGNLGLSSIEVMSRVYTIKNSLLIYKFGLSKMLDSHSDYIEDDESNIKDNEDVLKQQFNLLDITTNNYVSNIKVKKILYSQKNNVIKN